MTTVRKTATVNLNANACAYAGVIFLFIFSPLPVPAPRLRTVRPPRFLYNRFIIDTAAGACQPPGFRSERKERS